MAATIDSLKLYDRLRTKLPDEEARVIADALADVVESELATKRDIKELEFAMTRDIKELEFAMTRDVKELEIAMKRDLKELESATKRDLKELELKLEARISEGKSEIIKWMIGVSFAQIALILAVFRLFT